MAKKSTNAETTRRVNEVYALLARAYTRQQVIQHCSNWEVSDRQIDTYILRARQLLDKDADMTRPAFLAEALVRLRVLEQKAEQKGQLATAIASVRLQAELIGLTT